MKTLLTSILAVFLSLNMSVAFHFEKSEVNERYEVVISNSSSKVNSRNIQVNIIQDFRDKSLDHANIDSTYLSRFNYIDTNQIYLMNCCLRI